VHTNLKIALPACDKVTNTKPVANDRDTEALDEETLSMAVNKKA